MISFNTFLAIHQDFVGEFYRSASTLQARNAARIESMLRLSRCLASAPHPRAVIKTYMGWYSASAASLADDIEEQFKMTARMMGKVLTIAPTEVPVSTPPVAQIEKIHQQAAEPPAARDQQEEALTRSEAA